LNNKQTREILSRVFFILPFCSILKLLETRAFFATLSDKNMGEKHFEQSMNPKEHIQSELEDAGISHPSEWREALDLDSPLEGEERVLGQNLRRFEELFSYLEEDREIHDNEKIKKFSETLDSIERLEILASMSLKDSIKCLKQYSDSDIQYRYLVSRLDFYQKFIQGKATRKEAVSGYASDGRWKDNTETYPIDPSDATPTTIRLGILRDILYSAMQGTPEMGAVKIATKWINEDSVERAKKIGLSRQPSKIKSAVEFFGHYSGIYEGVIGQYGDLRELYKKCANQAQRRYKKEQLTNEQLEHKAVLSMARKLEGAYEYNGIVNVSRSPYSAGFKEAVSAGQLGHKVMRQMRGMRNKIQETNFEHIDRFIGKSGDNRYAPEKKKLDTNVEALKEYLGIVHSGKIYTWGDQKLTDKEAAQAFVEQENSFAIQKQQRWIERETERLNHKFEKSRTEIEKANLPEEEKGLQLQSVAERHENAIASVRADYEAEIAHLQERTPEQLLADLEQRQIVVNERYEKRKSLAQKALDLHFRINHTGGDYGSKPLGGIVDWINYAPLGAIKRGHKMMRLGMSDETITEFALADIITGARGATREDLKFVHGLVEKAKWQDQNARHTLESMMEVGNILSVSDYEVSLAEVADLAGKSFYGMTEALKMFDLDQVKQFMTQGINLQSITTVKKVTEKYGHELSPVEVAEIASHNIDGLDESLRSFSLDDIRVLLKQDVHLSIAVAVLNNTRQFGYELDVVQITNVAKNVRDINDFTSALRGLPLKEVEKIFSDGIAYSEYGQVKQALEKHQLDSGFTAVHSLAKKLKRTREYYNLDSTLDTFTLEEVEQILDKGSVLSGVLDVGNAFKTKGITTNLQEIILFEKYAGDYSKRHYVSQSVDAFGIDNVRKIVAKSCRLDKAIEVNNYINGDSSRSRRYGSSDDGISESLKESLKKGGLDVVIAIAKAGNMEVAVKTIEAGFTAEEITRFPFLISPLVTKK